MNNKRFLSVFTATALSALFFAFSASAITTGSADITSTHNVTLNCSYSGTSPIKFQLGTNSSLSGARVIFANTDCTASAINLLSSTTYYFRAVAGNEIGSINSFTMPGASGGTSGSGSSSSSGNSNGSSSNSNGSSSGSSSGSNSSSGSSSDYSATPSVLTNGPVSVSSNTAIVNGSINPGNLNTQFWFEFGTAPSLGKSTSVEQLGSGSAWHLVTGNLSGLQPGKTYYYRVAASNNLGIVRGQILNFTTQGINNGVGGGTNSTGGQVLGAYSGTNLPSSSGQDSLRPSFMSMEYSLNDNDALVLIASDVHPKSGDRFSYTIAYKNDTKNNFNEANLKVIIPSEAFYDSASIDPIKTSSNVVDFNLGTIRAGEQGSLLVVVTLRDNVPAETNLIFTSVLGYKNNNGIQLASTNYMKVISGAGETKLTASLWDSIGSAFSFLWIIGLGLVVALGFLIYRILQIKKGKVSEAEPEVKEDEPFLPPTFEQIDNFIPVKD